MDSCERGQRGVLGYAQKRTNQMGQQGLEFVYLKLHTDQADLTLELHGNSEATAGVRRFQRVKPELYNFKRILHIFLLPSS